MIKEKGTSRTKMSKIDTLISLINYQRQHPKANKSQIAKGVGITPQYLSRCLGELNLLKEHLSPALETDQIHFLVVRTGSTRSLSRGDSRTTPRIPKSLSLHWDHSAWLTLTRNHHVENSLSASLSAPNNRSSDYLHPAIQFSLDRLCYDSLFGSIGTERLNGDLQPPSNRPRTFSSWTITLRTDLRWSDGKPIIREDVIEDNFKEPSCITD